MILLESIGIFLTFLVIVFSVFCLITWTYNRRLKKYIDEAIDVVNQQNNKYIVTEQDLLADQTLEITMVKQTTALKINLSKLSQISGIGSNRMLPSFPTSSKSKSLSLIMRNPFDDTKNSQDQSLQKKSVKYSYINRIANYSVKGIEIIEKDLRGLKTIKVFREGRWIEEIKQRHHTTKNFYEPIHSNFIEIMDLLKLQTGEFGCIKFTTILDMKPVELNQESKIQKLAKNELFQLISEQEYAIQAQKMIK